MRRIINDETLGRLVAYEKYVKQCYAQTASRRWRTMNAGAVREYKQIKEFKNYISALVDHAFDRYGIENGLIRSASSMQDLALFKDLESLVAQLHWHSSGFQIPSPKRKFALVS